MTGLLYLLAGVAAGGCACGLLRIPLRLEERVLISIVLGLCAGGTLTFLVALATGSMSTAAAFAGPALLLVVALLAAFLVGDPRTPWMASWRDARTRWSTGRLWRFSVVAVVLMGFLAYAFHQALFTGPDGGLLAGWENVWSDWANHASTATSFAYGNNVPPQSSIYAGTAQLYPFMPDFQAGVLMLLGWPITAALTVMSCLVAMVAALLVVCLAERLTGSYLAGGVTVSICLFGAGLAFVGVMTDACSMVLTGAPYPASLRNQQATQPLDPTSAATLAVLDQQCTTGYVFQDPLNATSLLVHSLGKLPAVLSTQPRAYDTDLDSSNQFSEVQWYTPLMAWWLPQRSFLYGFAMALSVLLTLWVALAQAGRAPPSFAVAGVLGGLLPLFHVHSLFVLVMVLPFAMWHWRERWREWAAFVAAGTVVALPRLLQLVAGPHGSVTGGNNFPRVEVGWKAFGTGDTAAQFDHLAAVLTHPFLLLPQWWSFWIWNTGGLLPLCTVVLLCALARNRNLGAVSRWGQRVTGFFGGHLLRFVLPFMLVFLVANVVVFQSWDWDNTKLFIYWQFAAGLLVGALVSRWWRAGLWRPALAMGLTASLLALGVISTARVIPDSRALTVGPGSAGVAGFGFASAPDVQLAARLRTLTPEHAVFLTSEAVNDPAVMLAGRATLLGYPGWLSSYGIDYGPRAADVATMYQGCPPGASDTGCAALPLLRTYHVGYAEIWNDVGVGGLPSPGQQWWRAHFCVISASDHIAVYDVGRGPSC